MNDYVLSVTTLETLHTHNDLWRFFTVFNHVFAPCRIGDEVSRVEVLQVVLEWAGQLDEESPWAQGLHLLVSSRGMYTLCLVVN